MKEKYSASLKALKKNRSIAIVEVELMGLF
jgi:hypothetical protein